MPWFFIAAVCGLVVFMCLLVAFPWLKQQRDNKNIHQANVAVVKQRLSELQREVDEGVLSELDMRQASDEIKIALVEETQPSASRSIAVGPFILVFGALLALSVGGWAYYSANNIGKLSAAQQAVDSLSDLSEKLAAGEGNSLTAKDFQQLTYAIRVRLQEHPEDAQGWMYLGRIWMALEQSTEAFDALEKALLYAPRDVAVRMTYARALLASDDRSDLSKAQQVLTSLLAEQPNNDNLVLMQAVVAGRLGNRDLLASSMQYLEGKLPQDNPVVIQLQQRLTSLSGENQQALTGFKLTISVSDAIKASLPDEGYLFVFAQDALSDKRMPAAVLRLPISEFPATVTLTNQNAMTPSFSLLHLQSARLVARLSMDAEAPAQQGDFEGATEAQVQLGSIVEKTILIDEELM